jgi:hypothetical protein
MMKKAVENYDGQCAEFAKLFVPKCEAHIGMPFCTEHNTCNRHPLLKDIYAHFKDPKYAEFDQMIEDVKSGMIDSGELAEKFWEAFCEEEN